MLRELFEPFPVNDVLDLPAQIEKDFAKQRRSVARLPHGAPILRLLDAVDAHVENGPIVTLVDPRLLGERWFACMGQYVDRYRLRGEERARRLARVGADASEQLYAPYTAAIWSGARLLDRRLPLNLATHGARVNELIGMPLTTDVVDSRSAHFRNAIIHARFEVHPKLQAVEMWDVNQRGHETWRDALSYPALAKLTSDMITVPTTLQQAAGVFVIRAFAKSGAFEILPDLVRATRVGDDIAIARYAHEMNVRSERIFVRLRAAAA